MTRSDISIASQVDLLYTTIGWLAGYFEVNLQQKERMITVIKQDTQGKTKISYQGKVINYLPDGVIIQASWTLPAKDLGYTVFEPGDRFIEYYYTDRWFNIFDIATSEGSRKGWYCNIAEPATIFVDRIEQVDLLLDVWVAPDGKTLILDEDEFVADTTLTSERRRGAEKALQELLGMIESRQEMFASILKGSHT